MVLTLTSLSINRLMRSAQKRINMNSSKFPPAFKIDIHVDDSDGIRLEGERFGFKTIIVDPNDPSWTSKVMNSI